MPLDLTGIGAVANVVSGVMDRFWPKQMTEAEKASANLAILEALKASDLAQIEVNKAEAAHASWFVAGWRPAVGWTCAAAFAYTFVVQPFMYSMLGLFGVKVPLPILDMGALMTVLLGMLGMGGMRSWEKSKGVAR